MSVIIAFITQCLIISVTLFVLKMQKIISVEWRWILFPLIVAIILTVLGFTLFNLAALVIS